MGAEATPPEAVGPTGPPGPPSLEDRVASLETRLDEVIKVFNDWTGDVTTHLDDLASGLTGIIDGTTRVQPPPVLTAAEAYEANLRRERAQEEVPPEPA